MRYIAKGIFKDGKILYDYGFECDQTFKTIAPIKDLAGSAISLDGFVYPAFVESHAHIGELSNLLSYIDGREKTFKELKEIILKTSEPVYIFNVDFNTLTGNDFKELSSLPKNIYIKNKDGHSVFVSQKFLKESHINIDNLDKDSLGFVEDEFVGIFKDSAIDAVKHLKKTRFTKEHLKRVEDYFLSRGIVSVTNFDFDIYEILKENTLNIRIIQGIAKSHLKDFIKEGIKTGDGDDNFKWGPLKIFLDGSLGSQTAAMLDEKPFKGLLLMDEKELEEIVKDANENGISVAVHAIGSKAVHVALSVFNRLSYMKVTNRIEHLQFIDERDLKLLKETPFVPSMQPVHAVSDEMLYKRYMGNYRYAYAWNTVFSLKGFLIFGSDAPVEDASVLEGLSASINRPYLQEESIPLLTALKAYTEFGALYNYSDNRGKIEKGFLADFVVLKEPINEDNLLTNEIIATAKDGIIK